MKLLLLIEIEGKGNSFVKYWIDENKIDAFWVDPELYEDEISLINLVMNGQVYSVVKNNQLELFLDKKFKVGYHNKIEIK